MILDAFDHRCHDCFFYEEFCNHRKTALSKTNIVHSDMILSMMTFVVDKNHFGVHVTTARNGQLSIHL